MALAVCLLFDPPGDRLVRGLWSRLEASGVATPLTHTHGRHRPHLSLAVARDWDLPRLQQLLAALPRAEASSLTLPGTVAFTRGRVALAVATTSDLALRQECVTRVVLASGAELHRHYAPGRWVPHVSVATGGAASQLGLISTMVNDALPLSLRVDSAALINSGTGELWPMPLV